MLPGVLTKDAHHLFKGLPVQIVLSHAGHHLAESARFNHKCADRNLLHMNVE